MALAVALALALAEKWPFLQIQLWPQLSHISVFVFGQIYKLAHTTTAMFHISTVLEKLMLNCQTSLC
jgi:hypothetical protein